MNSIICEIYILLIVWLTVWNIGCKKFSKACTSGEDSIISGKFLKLNKILFIFKFSSNFCLIRLKVSISSYFKSIKLSFEEITLRLLNVGLKCPWAFWMKLLPIAGTSSTLATLNWFWV